LSKIKKIILTGGGTAGHVSPNLALVPSLRQAGWDLEYIGSHGGIEEQLVKDAGIPYHPIASGKLRRYFDWQNFIDPFKVIKGVADAYFLLGKLQPDLVFSKGGFVTMPVVLASWLRRIPAIVHESDFSPGLTNKISIPFATKVCVTFPETLIQIQSKVPQAVCTGLPIRSEILRGDGELGRKFCNFDKSLPVLLVIGGSLGSARLNRAVREILPELLTQFQLVHICGHGHIVPEFECIAGYAQFQYLKSELANIFALADLVVSRAGANAVFELLALRKPHLLIPLSELASRGDQVQNANSFAQSGFSQVLLEENLTSENLTSAIANLYSDRQRFIDKMTANQSISSIDKIIQLISQAVERE
jgi:UDP-N-acetylglucosamine--N-acetylmuramyl-(pentapeptide) pyrophosphoryl-undecaprenol N-acetylglucosamine transferase